MTDIFKHKEMRIMLILVAAAVILFFIYFAIASLNNDEQVATTEQENYEILIHKFDPSDINSITFVYNDVKTKINQSNGTWHLSGAPNTKLNKSLIGSITKHLELLLATYDVGTATAEDLEQFGFNDSKCYFTVSEDGREHTYVFGNYNSRAEGYYLLDRSSDHVYVVSQSDIALFYIYPEDLPDTDIIPKFASDLEIVLDGNKVTDEEVCQNLRSITISHCVDTDVSSHSTYQPNGGHSLSIGENVYTIGVGESDEYFYLLVGDSEAVFVAKCSDMPSLMNLLKN